MNLLTDPILRVETGSGLKRLSLPRLLAALGTEEVYGFPGIQRHQEDAFYVFLCYLAGAILARADKADPKQSEEFWRQGMRQLAHPFEDEAWTLVVEDLAKPAFMQPPLEIRHFSGKTDCPDTIDATELSKNHDVKMARGCHAFSDQWVFALISANFNATYSKGGREGFYFPTVKTKKNRVGRVYVRATVLGQHGRQWQFDVSNLLALRSSIIEQFGYRDDGLVLLWLLPWDGHSSVKLSDLDPYFLEVTRAIRLAFEDQRIVARYAPTRAPRVFSKLQGNVGDSFVPIDVADDSAIAIGSSGWRAEILRQIVFLDNIRWPLLGLAGSKSTSEELVLRCASLVRSAKGSEGYQTKQVTISGHIRKRLFFDRAQRDAFASLSKSAIEYAGKMQNEVLKPAVFAYFQGGPDKIKFDDDTAQAIWPRFARTFETSWSDAFFPWLWSVPEPVDEEKALRDWALKLKDFALCVLREVESALPARAGRKYKAKIAASRKFTANFSRIFPFLKEDLHASA